MDTAETSQQRERVIETYKRWAHIIQSHHEDSFHIIEKALTERTLQIHVFNLPKDTPVLDIGGGDGRWSRLLAKHGFTNILLNDISPDILNVAQKHIKEEGFENQIRVQELDAENFVLAERFGMVLCLGGVLSHCLNYQKALQNIYNVLQEKGTAIFSVDSFYAAKFTAAFVDDPIELDMLLSQGISRQYFNVRPLYYCKYFRYQELKAALVQNKFKPVIIRSRPQVTGWDLHARFSGLEDFQKTLEKEIKLSERQELLDYGYQLEAVVTK